MMFVRTEGDGRIGVKVKVRALEGVEWPGDLSDVQKPVKHGGKHTFEHIHFGFVGVEAVAGVNDAV